MQVSLPFNPDSCKFIAGVAAYADDKVTEAKTWDRDGKLVADDQFDADGSRKLRR